MLPSSHDAFINYDPARDRIARTEYFGPPDCAGFSVPLSAALVDDSSLLASAFSQFVAASGRLEDSYRQLQRDVLDLRRQLSERDCALLDSLSENARIRESLQQILDSMPCGVLVLNDKAQAVLMNPESRRLLGLTFLKNGDQHPLSVEEICNASGISLKCLGDGMEDPEAVQTLCTNTADGPRWLEIRRKKLELRTMGGANSDQEILVVRDITAQRRAEDEREAVRNAVAVAETMSIIAHEIRNPLASLELFSELIETDDVLRSQWVANLRAGIRRLGGTVNNVLNFRSGELQLSAAKLGDVFRSALDFAGPVAVQSGLGIEVTDNDDAREVVMLNECAIQQLIINLVSNSARYTPAGGTIAISYSSRQPLSENSSAEASSVLVEIRDNGCGIRADQIDHIFEPGFSGGGETPGLGLAVCDRIMRMHGGDIRVENRHPGAKFTLRFPILRSEVA